VFRDFREKVLAETSYGLPYVVETEPRDALRREMEAAKDRLLNLPDEQTQVVYDFNHSEVGEFLLGIENNTDAGQTIGTPRLNSAVEFGTRLPATGTLLWFAPAAERTPTPVLLTDAAHGEIVVQGLTLGLERRGDEWSVAAPQRLGAPPGRR
jgi:hypothetical protein